MGGLCGERERSGTHLVKIQSIIQYLGSYDKHAMDNGRLLFLLLLLFVVVVLFFPPLVIRLIHFLLVLMDTKLSLLELL